MRHGLSISLKYVQLVIMCYLEEFVEPALKAFVRELLKYRSLQMTA